MRKTTFLLIGIMVLSLLPALQLSKINAGNSPLKISPLDYVDSNITQAQFITNFKAMANEYSSIVTYNSSGKSYQNNDSWTFYVGNGPKTLMIDSEIHGDEYYGALALYYFLDDWLLPSTDATAKRILNDWTLVCTPSVNPDHWGVSRKNMNGTMQLGGIDLNRNFSPGWNVSGTNDPNNWKYAGSNALDQNESIAIANLMQKINPTAVLDLHVAGAYPGTTMNESLLWDGGNGTQYNTTCTTIYKEWQDTLTRDGLSTSDVNSFPSNPPMGTTMDQGLQDGASVAFTLEIGNSDTPVDISTYRMWTLRDLIISIDLYFNQASFGMKTKDDGFFFYWPNVTTSGIVHYIKVEEWFTNVNAGADNWGNTSMESQGYSFEFPDGKVDGKDVAKEALYFGACESDPNNPTYPWTNKTYMADIDLNGSSLRSIDGKDTAWTALHFGSGSTSWYNTNMADIYVKFYFNNQTTEIVLVDSNGWVKVPADSGNIGLFRTYYTTEMDDVGAFVTFWS